MRHMESRLRKLEEVKQRPIAFVWHDQQNKAELRAQIAEREAKGFRALVVGWKRTSGGALESEQLQPAITSKSL
jgi:hypothetical protein